MYFFTDNLRVSETEKNFACVAVSNQCPHFQRDTVDSVKQATTSFPSGNVALRISHAIRSVPILPGLIGTTDGSS